MADENNGENKDMAGGTPPLAKEGIVPTPTPAKADRPATGSFYVWRPFKVDGVEFEANAKTALTQKQIEGWPTGAFANRLRHGFIGAAPEPMT